MSDDPMLESHRESFHAALVRTRDWRRHGGPEPECYLENRPLPASTFFDFMTKFAEPMPPIDLNLALQIIGGVRETERADIERDPSYGTAAKHLARRIKDELEQREKRR
jgi:hypothetical protein